MIDFIASNLGSIVVSLVLALMVGAIVLGMVRDKKRGKGGCGCGCKGCANAPLCHPESHKP